VASEIESHTGILAAASIDNIEFCHLSLQEYLAADYIVREGSARNYAAYFREYQAPIAVAIALSSNASELFAELVLRAAYFFGVTTIPRDIAQPLIRRLILERPYFAVSTGLGLAVTKILSDTQYREDGLQDDGGGQKEYARLVRSFLQTINVRASVQKSLQLYGILMNEYAVSDDKGMIPMGTLWRDKTVEGLPIPERIKLDKKTLCQSKAYEIEVNAITHRGVIRKLSDNEFAALFEG